MEEITFFVRGVPIAADLYLPPDLKPGERRPAVVAGQGFSFVKEGLVPQGKYFSAAGYIVLAIDYRSFGRSGGETRGELFPLNMVEDFRSAISYLETRPEVEADRIGIWGTSFGGALVLATAAVDRRVRAVIAQVPVTDGRRWMQAIRTTGQWEDLLDRIEADRRLRFSGKESARIPVLKHWASEEFAAMPTDHQALSFQTIMKEQVKTWRLDIAMESMEKVIEFNPTATIAQIAPRPLCMIAVSGYDAIHPMEHILDAFAKASEPKTLELLPYDQLGLYGDPGESHALQVAVNFLNKHLPIGQAVGGAVKRSKWEVNTAG